MRNFATQVYSAYSAYYGTAKPKVWAKKAKALGHRAICITDRQTMAGVLQLEEASRELGIKAIHGYDFYLYETNGKEETNKCLGRCIVYAQNMKGYYNLIAVNNFSCKPLDNGGGFYYRPRMNVDKLLELSKGLILVIPEAGGGDLFEAITKPRSKLYGVVSQLASVFSGRFFVGVNTTITPELAAANYPMIPSQDVRCLVKKDIEAAKALLDLDDGHTATNIINGKNPTALEEISDEVDERLLSGLDKFYDLVEDRYLKIKDYKLPPIQDPDIRGTLLKAAIEGFRKKLCPELPKDMTFDRLLEEETLNWLDTKYSVTLAKANHINKTRDSLKNYALRLKEEVRVIDLLNKQGYFYPLWEAFKASDANGFEHGPGRGSGAGSLYLYLLNLTMMDPIAEDLIFER